MTDKQGHSGNPAPPVRDPLGAVLAGDPDAVAGAVSLAIAAGVFLLFFTVSDLRAPDAGLLKRMGLAFFLVGGVSAAAHGLNLTPRLDRLRFVMRPKVAWPAAFFGGLFAWLA